MLVDCNGHEKFHTYFIPGRFFLQEDLNLDNLLMLDLRHYIKQNYLRSALGTTSPKPDALPGCATPRHG